MIQTFVPDNSEQAEVLPQCECERLLYKAELSAHHAIVATW